MRWVEPEITGLTVMVQHKYCAVGTVYGSGVKEWCMGAVYGSGMEEWL